MTLASKTCRWRWLALSSLLVAGFAATPVGAQGPSARTAVPAPSISQQRVGAIPQWLAFYPVVVLPKNKGFHDLQDALDFCAARPSTPWTVVLGPGTFTGNFTLPPAGSTLIVGRDGIAATTIEGEPGVFQPVLSFSPVAGPTRTEALIFSVQIRATDQAVLDYQGSGSHAELMLQDCFVDSEANTAAIRMSGGGYDDSNQMGLELGHSWVESESGGIHALVDSHVDVHCVQVNLHADDTGISLQGTASSQGLSLHYYGGRVKARVALRLIHVDDVKCEPYEMDSGQIVADLRWVAHAEFSRTDLTSLTSDVIRASDTSVHLAYVQLKTDGGNPSVFGLRAENSSQAYVAYCGFSTAGISALSNSAITVDGSSTATTAFNHWMFDPMP